MENVKMNDANTNSVLASREVVQNYLSDEKVSANLVTWAKAFDEKFRGNSFSLEQVIKKTPVKNRDEAETLLGIMVLKGYAFRVYPNNQPKFKISLSKEVKIKLLEAKLEGLLEQCTELNLELDKLRSEVSQSSSSE